MIRKTVWVIYREEDKDVSCEFYETRQAARNELKRTAQNLTMLWAPISKSSPTQLKKMFKKLIDGYLIKKAVLLIH